MVGADIPGKNNFFELVGIGRSNIRFNISFTYFFKSFLKGSYVSIFIEGKGDFIDMISVERGGGKLELLLSSPKDHLIVGGSSEKGTGFRQNGHHVVWISYEFFFGIREGNWRSYGYFGICIFHITGS